jgi:hypothetical protein
MAITISPSADLKVAVAQDNAAGCAGKAPRVEFLARVRLQVLAFNTTIACST